MGERSRRWGPVRVARGSVPPQDSSWLAEAFPTLAARAGARARLAAYLATAREYPAVYAELVRLDRARAQVKQAPSTGLLMRRDLTLERELRLVPAHAFVEVTTTSNEVWRALACGDRAEHPRPFDGPRHVLVWRSATHVQDRVLDPDETSALRAAARGTSIIELAAGFTCDNAHARVIDLVLRWIDGDLILG